MQSKLTENFGKWQPYLELFLGGRAQGRPEISLGAPHGPHGTAPAVVVYRTCGYAGIGPPSATRGNPQCETNQARSRTIHNHGRLRIVCMTARLDVTPKTTEQNRIVRTGKSEAEVTNNKKTALEVLYYWRNEANYWQTRNIARPLCDSRATCWLGRTYHLLVWPWNALQGHQGWRPWTEHIRLPISVRTKQQRGAGEHKFKDTTIMMFSWIVLKLLLDRRGRLSVFGTWRMPRYVTAVTSPYERLYVIIQS